jgi:hypothetical protein
VLQAPKGPWVGEKPIATIFLDDSLRIRIMAATTRPLATAQDAAPSEGERHGFATCLVKCPDGDKACVNRCMSKSQIKGVAWSDATRTCIRTCRIQNAANEVVFGCVSGCLDRMVR